MVISTIILAVGAAALGGPDALRVLLAVAGKNPAVDVAICAFAIAAATSTVLGTVLLARFLRRLAAARNAAGDAPPAAAELLPRMVRMVAVAVAVVIAACLLAAPAGSELDAGKWTCAA
ncbi:hypothetical protein ACP4OV_016894 [Aristida adscensionis]